MAMMIVAMAALHWAVALQHSQPLLNISGVYRDGPAQIVVTAADDAGRWTAVCHVGAQPCGWPNATGTLSGRNLTVVFQPSGTHDQGKVVGQIGQLQLRWDHGGVWLGGNPPTPPGPPSPPPPPPPWQPSPYSFDVTQLTSAATSTGAIVCGRWSNDSAHAAAQCSDTTQNSDFSFNYNPSHVQLPGSNSGDALLVRTQARPGDPSRMSLLKRLAKPGVSPSSMRFERSTEERIVFAPLSGPDSPDAFGTEDPYLTLREKDQTYYLFYTAVAYNYGQSLNATLSLATCRGDPAIKSCWQRRGPVLAQHSWMGKTCCGGLLLRDDVSTADDPHPCVWFPPELVRGCCCQNQLSHLNGACRLSSFVDTTIYFSERVRSSWPELGPRRLRRATSSSHSPLPREYPPPQR
jgi:hypothetical protein